MGNEIRKIHTAIRELYRQKIYPSSIAINKYLGRKGGLTKDEKAARTAIMRDLKIRKRARGKGKGPVFEREVCTRLSLWWSGGERDDIFWRTHGSGARATTRGKAGKKTAGQYGDVATSDPIGLPLIQCLTLSLKKGYNRHTLHDLLDKPAGAALQTWDKWIEEITRTAWDAGSWSWAIIAKRDRREPLMILHRKAIKPLRLDPLLIFGRLVVIPFSDFVEYVNPKNIRSLVKKWHDARNSNPPAE
jgi:hypothetical protein